MSVNRDEPILLHIQEFIHIHMKIFKGFLFKVHSVEKMKKGPQKFEQIQ